MGLDEGMLNHAIVFDLGVGEGHYYYLMDTSDGVSRGSKTGKRVLACWWIGEHGRECEWVLERHAPGLPLYAIRFFFI